MAIDVETPKSDGWWMHQLARRLHDRRIGRGWSRTGRNREGTRPGIELLDSYLRGDPPLPKCAEGWKTGMWEFLRLSRMNYAEMVVGAAVDRMVPLGWRTAVEDDRDGDQKAAEVAARNAFDISTGDVFTGMLGHGDSYMIVGEPWPGTEVPVVTAEDGREVITAHDPRTGAGIAGLKLFRDDWDSADFAYLYLPGRVAVAVHKSKSSVLTRSGALRFSPSSWDWDEDRSGSLPQGLKDRLPVVRFRNRGGVGEYEPHLDVLDRINDTLFERVTIAKYQAFRQRAIKGLPDKDDQGVEIDYSDAFMADPGGLWQLPPDSDIWESQTIDLTPILSSIKDDVEGLMAVTRTPLYYSSPDAANGSAEGASTMREGHVYRVEDRRRRAGSGLAEVMSLAFAAMGETARAEAYRIRTIWQPAERYSLTERFSAASQAKASGLPQSSIYTDVLQYAPEDIPRLERERATDLLFQPPGQPAAVTGRA